MEVKIKEQDKLVDATIEMVDGAMVVSPKDVKEDVSQFNTGDVLVCGWEYSTRSCEWICILDGRVDKQSHMQYYFEIFCGMYTKGYNGIDDIWLEHSYSDSATYVRFATEEEKQKLFDRLAEEGLEWNAELKQMSKIKWNPKYGDSVYIVTASINSENIFTTSQSMFGKSLENAYEYNRVFKTEQECQELCDRLNQAISSVKP